MTIARSKSKVYLFFETRAFSLQNRTQLKKFIEALFKKERKNLKSLNYIFTSDTRLLSINQDFLKHDFYTDIITFDNSSGNGIEGEVYISIDRVQENAASLNIAFREELLRVMFHGALHLCGYKDKNRSEIRQMRSKEDYYLQLFKSKA